MRYFFLFFIVMIVTPIWSQKTEVYSFAFTTARLETVLTAIEKQFDVKYSYVDSIVATKTITLSKEKYSLEQLHTDIETQTSLTIVKINQRYYSLYKATEDSLQAEQLKEIIVEGFLTKGINKVSQKVLLSPQKIEALPGVTDADILLSLQQLPGVKSPNETASGLHIRGGTSDQNLILWDGIRMYHPGHLFGMISGFNPNVEQTVHYYNKATNPRFGERISSVIDIQSTDKIEKQLKVDAGINALNADIYVQAPLIKNKLGLQVSGRKSFTEWLQTFTFNALAEKVFQNTNFKNFNDRNQFEFEDYSAKLNYKPNATTEFSFTSVLIDNYLNFKTQPDTTEDDNQRMNILNQGYSFHWNQKYSAQFSQKFLLYYSAYTFDYEKNQQYSDGRFEVFKKLNRITDSGMEMNFNYEINPKLNFEFGYQFLGNDVSHSYTTKTQNLFITLDQMQLYSTTHVGYSYFKYTLNQWNFQAGARFNSFSKIQTNSLEPRVFLQRNLTNTLIWQLSFERKSQIISQVQESVTNDLSLENYIWILSDNKEYPIQKANQYTSGFIYKTKSWLFDVDAYYKTINGITSLTFGFLHQHDPNIHNGKGFTKGLDILIQKTAPTWRAWMTYTYQDSQSKFDGLNDSKYFPINSDITHAFNLAFNKKWNNYSIALGWFWHSGKPYSLLDDSNQVSSFNTERLPAYHRLDFSAMYHFHPRQSWSGKVGFSLYNAYNQHTVISKEYQRSYVTINTLTSKYTIQDYYSLGITPNLFLRVSF